DRVVDLAGANTGALRDHRRHVLAGVAGIGDGVVAVAIGVDAGQHAVAVLQVGVDAGPGQFAGAQPPPAGGAAARGVVGRAGNVGQRAVEAAMWTAAADRRVPAAVRGRACAGSGFGGPLRAEDSAQQVVQSLLDDV